MQKNICINCVHIKRVLPMKNQLKKSWQQKGQLINLLKRIIRISIQILNFFPTCRIGFQKDHLCFIGLRFLPLKRRRSRQLLPINYGESLQIIYSISGISPQEGRVAFKKCHICCVTIERNVPGKTKRKAAKRKSLPYFTSVTNNYG